jgi:L-fucose isomerase-like protein
MTINDRRDSFCGKLSVCNNLVQFRIPFTLTSKHVMDPSSPDFRQDLVNFIATCNVISGLNGARFGAVGARPAAFNTVRFSEKLLAASNILVDTVDLFDVFGKVDKIGDSDELVQARLAAIKEYVSCEGIPDAALLKMATFGVILEKMREENGWTGTAVQCWTAIEEFFGVVPCSVMSEESQGLNESACEVDIMGLISQTSLRLASGRPAALVDFNNGFADDDDLCVVFHCSNLPKCMFCSCRMDYQEIIAGTVGKENTYGTVVGKIANGPFTFARLTTNDVGGCITGYVGQGEMVDTGVQTFGGFGEARIQNMQKLLRHLCLEGYEHHVAITQAGVAAAVAEAWRYLGWQTYQHE